MREVAYLDTTVFADLTFGGRETRAKLRALLDGRDVRTSTYVRQQFKATFLQAAVRVHNELLAVSDVMQVLRSTDSWSCFRTREGVKARMILATLLEHSGTSIEAKLRTLERLIEVDLMRDFDELATSSDETRCCQCPKEPNQDDNGVYLLSVSCTLKTRNPCTIEAYWNSRLDFRNDLADGGPPSGSIPAPISAAAEEARQGKPARGKRCSVKLSDAVIAGESPPCSQVVTSNAKDFVPVVAVLGGSRSVSKYSK